MKMFLPFAMVCILGVVGTTVSLHAAEEKVEVKEKKDGSWKMKVKRKGDKEWVGTVDGKSYTLRGDYDFSTIKDEDEYTVYGTLAPDSTYITTTKVVRIDH